MASTTPLQDGWDWPFIIYVGTVWLRRSEEEVWNMTPKKLYALLKVHIDLESAKSGSTKKPSGQAKGTYIDNIPGW